MANYSYTTNELMNDRDRHYMFTGHRCRPDRLYRKIHRARACSFMQDMARWPFTFGVQRRRAPTLPQFSGTINPVGARAVELCMYSDSSPSVTLETMTADGSGDFECKGWYRPESTGKYFFRPQGDKNYSIKDFPVQPPVENEYFDAYGVKPDTSTGLRTQYVEDHFDGIQASLLNDHTPDIDTAGNGWAGSANTLIGVHGATSPNFTTYTNTASPQVNYIDVADADVVIQAHFVFGDSVMQSGEHGFVLRYVDDDNYLRVVIHDADADRISMSLISKVATVDTTLQTWTAPTGSGPLDLDQYYRLTVCAYGSTIHYDFETYGTLMTYHKVAQWSVKDVTDHQTATKHGIYTGGIQMYTDRLRMWSV